MSQTHAVHHGEVQSPAPGEEQSPVPIYTMYEAAGKQLCRKGLGSSSGNRGEHEQSVRPCSKGAEQYPGLH